MDQRFIKRVKRRDRMARAVITVGGMTIIFSVIFILLLIGQVTLPLFQAPESQVHAKFMIPERIRESGILGVGVDEYLEHVFVVDANGEFAFFSSPDGKRLPTFAAAPPAPGVGMKSARKQGPLTWQLIWDDGSLSIERIKFSVRFDEDGNRSFDIGLERKTLFPPPAPGEPVLSLARGEDGDRIRIDLHGGGRIGILQESASEDIFGNMEEQAFDYFLEEAEGLEVSALALDNAGRYLYAGTSGGELLRWDLGEAGEPQLLDRLQATADKRSITALDLMLGDISLAVADSAGGVTTWFPAPTADGGPERLQLIHRLAGHDAPVTEIVPSLRDKSLLTLDESGTIHLDHMTSERHLLTLYNLSPISHLGFSSRGNGVVGVNEEGRVVLWAVDNPHPEVSLKTLFGKVWYESYDEPVHAWQSSSASDDFEPKLSLTPLIFGTFKGTFYAMLFAVPLALLGAIYTSNFSSPAMRAWIKPTVEIMAAIPTVVIGFLAALWFAPLLEEHIVSFFLSIAFMPTAIVLALVLWQWVRRYRPLQVVERGYEFAAAVPILLLAFAVAVVLGPLVENLVFGGSFQMWLFNEAGARYDQRNSIVIAFALGFAVIPIIFTIAEDSLSNVPPSLRAASLALGASRWQTVWRVILPSASPGIFAGVMIGFGRAIGETMIVLMATGNTAIMDLSLFNGMRPLSSNIAVEIPEAPHGGTLYRVLFLTAVILFTLTFVLNTVAEVVRQRLRRKYGRFQ